MTARLLSRLTDRQLTMLRSIQHTPRPERSFTNGFLGVHPSVSICDLAALEDRAFVESSASGVYSITQAGEFQLANQPGITPAQSFGPLSTTGTYESEISKVPARGEGALAAYRLPSRGFA